MHYHYDSVKLNTVASSCVRYGRVRLIDWLSIFESRLLRKPTLRSRPRCEPPTVLTEQLKSIPKNCTGEIYILLVNDHFECHIYLESVRKPFFLHRNTYIVSAMRLSRNASDNAVMSVLLA
jgi:hypothetical protein